MPVSFSSRLFFPLALIEQLYVAGSADRHGAGGLNAVSRYGQLTGVGDVDGERRRAPPLVALELAEGEGVRGLDEDGKDGVDARKRGEPWPPCESLKNCSPGQGLSAR